MSNVFRMMAPMALRATACAALLVLNGCMLTGKDSAAFDLGLEDEQTVADATAAPANAKAKSEGYVDPMVANAAEPLPAYGRATSTDGTLVAQNVPAENQTTEFPQAPADLGQVIMQETGVNAGRSSIFSAYQPVDTAEAAPSASETPSSLMPAGMPQRPVNATNGSLFASPRTGPAPVPLTDEGALY